MTVMKIETGKHAGEYRVRVQPTSKITGKRISLPVEYARTQREAKQLETKLWLKYTTGQAYDAQNDPLADCFEEYVETEYQRGRWSDNTYASWRCTARVIRKYFPHAKLRNVTENQVREFARKFVADRKVDVSPKSQIMRCLTHMRSFFSEYTGSVFAQNPVPEKALEKFFRIDEVTTSHKRYVLTEEEMQRLISEITDGLNFADARKCVSRLAIYVDLQTGMRPQEIQALRWSNLCKTSHGYVFKINDSWDEHGFKFNGHLKSKPRGVERTTLPITNELATFLDQYRESQERFLAQHGIKNGNDLMFLNLVDYRKCELGYPVTQVALNNMLRKLSKKAEIEPGKERWSMYSLRHTVATKLGSTPGMSYPWAAARLGHRLDEFMGTYVHEDRDVDEQMTLMWMGR